MTPPNTTPQAAAAGSLDRGLVPRLGATVILAVIGILAFTAPWVRVAENDETLATTTLSGQWETDRFYSIDGSPLWAVGFAVLLTAIAIIVWLRPTAHAAASAASLGGFAALALLLFTWLGRGIWLDAGDLPEGMSLQMEWGYDLSLALSVILIALSAYLMPAKD